MWKVASMGEKSCEKVSLLSDNNNTAHGVFVFMHIFRS